MLFHEESLLTTIFKVLNVLVLFSVGFYFFKTRIASWIMEAIAEKKDAEKKLQDEKRSLKNKLKMIDDEIVEQQNLCEKIKTNIVKWNEVIMQEQAAARKEHEERFDQQEARAQQQSDYLTTLKAQKKIVPQAVADAQAELERLFTAQRGHAYMQAIVGQMRRKI